MRPGQGRRTIVLANGRLYGEGSPKPGLGGAAR